MSLVIWLKERIFGLKYKQVFLNGIECEPAVKSGLEEILVRFLDGYQLALESQNQVVLAQRLDSEIEPPLLGFAYEGAGMFLALMDFLTPWEQNRAKRFISGPGFSHDFIISVGAGFALARIPWARRNAIRYALRYPPGLASLVLDGYGFHEGFFHSSWVVDRCERPMGLAGYPGSCFDAGIGRAIWFVKGASPDRTKDTIENFPVGRQADLWAGLGLACAYAGSVYPALDQYESVLERLADYSGCFRSRLELGIVFAAGTQCKANNQTTWTTRACNTILGMSFADAARVALDTWNDVAAELKSRPADQIGFILYQRFTERVLVRLEERAQKGLAKA
jgi:hypothetical protein